MNRVRLGQTVITQGAIAAFEDAPEEPARFLFRHSRGDWGNLEEFDRQQNDKALETGERLLSSYELSTGVKIWIITEWDRSVTTILLPSEY